jgi:hypothetical protein
LIVGEYPNSPGFFGAGLGFGVVAGAAGKLPNIDNPVFLIATEPDTVPAGLKIEDAAPKEGAPAEL